MNPRTSATLADAAYAEPPPKQKLVTIDGTRYRVLDLEDSISGYQGIVYLNTKTNEVIVAHHGTEFERQPLLHGCINPHDAGNQPTIAAGVGILPPAIETPARLRPWSTTGTGRIVRCHRAMERR